MHVAREYIAEFQALIERASACVIEGDRELLHHRRLLRLRVFPSYPGIPSPYITTLLVSRSEQKPSYVVTHRCWDHEADERKLASPIERRCHPDVLEPTIVETQTPLSTRRGRGLHRALLALSLPPIPKDPHWGVDGATYDATLYTDHSSAVFSWWATAPDEWKPLGDLIDAMTKLAREA